MAEAFVELGAEGVNYIVENHFERGYDSVKRKLTQKGIISAPATRDTQTSPAGAQTSQDRTQNIAGPYASGNYNNENTAPSAVSGASGATRRKQKNRLPSPEGDLSSREAQRYRDDSLSRQSEHSEQVIRSYELERDDPRRKPESVLSRRDWRKEKERRRDSRNSNTNPINTTNRDMSYANGAGSQFAPPPPQSQYGGQSQRPQSAQPPRSRYYDDEEEYGSDYDERTGRRYRSSGRGYDDGYDDDGRGYDREVIETERYKGPARDWNERRQSQGSRGYTDYDGAAGGAVTRYDRRSEVASRRSRSRGASRGRRDEDSRSRSGSRSYSGSRSRSGERGGDRGIKGQIGKHFDTSMQGLGIGLAGAVVGGMAGRHFGERNPRHKNRDILIGAVIGGLGANAAEEKWREYSAEKKEKLREDEDRWEGGYGRSRSAMR